MNLSTKEPFDTLVGVDIGGTKVDVLVTDSELSPLAEVRSKVKSNSPEDFVSSIRLAVSEALNKAGTSIPQVRGIGIGIPGQVVPEEGTVRNAVNLELSEFPLARILSDQFDSLPIFLEKDVHNAAVDAFLRVNENNHIENLAFVNIGTGISAGLVLNGRLYRGEHGMAGEIGHSVFLPDGPHCSCGNFGCLEALAAGPAIERLGREAVESGKSTRIDVATSQGVFSAAAQGDEVAGNILQKVGGYLGQALQNLVMAYDVGKIVLGGGVSREGKRLLEPILQEWSRMAEASTLAASLLLPEIIEVVPADHKPGVWGAIFVAQKRLGSYDHIKSGNVTKRLANLKL
ncbi:MAG: ROK family protein [Chloroflexi bacterium]|nr:MAG: ROK family protein [Chloroflexota bacterium]MBL1196723.1 ROK family protein [Chloroflexota bacterium]